ncbi:hypothetical protein JQX13_32230 [Archangium violaceum]|uniref:hypothetical protein n=1 Tax=Archangium violaceum TaxID=83451 RepID=UPI00193B7F30|nr:hypothetical protein [Archangium violaceum]QRK04872.1 hypothetical protein JQX13_32230 [Archangium violaceum]
MMRTRLLLLGCLATACGGNFSNGDLEFLNALPAREDLSAKLPGAESFERMGLALGELSQLYANTRQVADGFNKMPAEGLFLMEELRKDSPTTRAPTLRIWGPMENPSHPGVEMRLKMERKPEGFQYRLEFRPMGSNEGAWWPIAEGSAQPDGGLRKGKGTLSILTAEIRNHGIDEPWLSGLERVDIDYQTSAPPMSVRMDFVPTATSSEARQRYAYRELPDGLGEMRFQSEDIDLVPGGQKEKVVALSRWTRDQGGIGILEATGGDVPAGSTATLVECWDASFRVTYRKSATDEVGNASACPDVSALGD